MKKGCLLLLGLALALGIGSVVIVVFHLLNKYNPVYHGKRVYAWQDQAIWDEDPAAREQAVQVLLEALHGMEGEPRTQLVMRFCHPRRHGQEKTEMPKEVLPFLIEALKIDEHGGGYAFIPLAYIPGPETVPALIDALRDERDAETRKRLVRVLGELGPKAKAAVPVLRDALRDENAAVRESAAVALKRIEPSER